MTQEEITRILEDNPQACTYQEAMAHLDRVRDTWARGVEIAEKYATWYPQNYLERAARE